jgi:hypothetical protein
LELLIFKVVDCKLHFLSFCLLACLLSAFLPACLSHFSFCDSFIGNPAPVMAGQQPPGPAVCYRTGREEQSGAAVGDGSHIPVQITPARLCRHGIPDRAKCKTPRCRKSESIEDFIAISRPLSTQKDKSKKSPRHVVLVEKHQRF